MMHTRTHCFKLAEKVKAGAETISTKNGESFIALIDEASKGLDDVAAGRVKEARRAIQSIKRRRSA